MITADGPATKTVTIINLTDENLTTTWDSIPYTLKAKSAEVCPDWLGRHFFKYFTRDGKRLTKMIEGEVYMCDACDEIFETKQLRHMHTLNSHKEKKS